MWNRYKWDQSIRFCDTNYFVFDLINRLKLEVAISRKGLSHVTVGGERRNRIRQNDLSVWPQKTTHAECVPHIYSCGMVTLSITLTALFHLTIVPKTIHESCAENYFEHVLWWDFQKIKSIEAVENIKLSMFLWLIWMAIHVWKTRRRFLRFDQHN